MGIIKIPGDFEFHVICNACNERHHFDNVPIYVGHGVAARHYLRSKDWLCFAMERTPTLRISPVLTICPRCADEVPWLKEALK
jgi:hypothetical protein